MRALRCLLFVPLVLSACLTAERPPVVDSSSAAAFTLPTSGTFQDGDERITWESSARDALLEVREQITFGIDGAARRTLHLDAAGRLVRVEESRVQTVQAPDRSPFPQQVTLDVRFAGDSVLRTAKRVDGVDAPVRPYEIDKLRRHAEALLSTFATRPSAARR